MLKNIVFFNAKPGRRNCWAKIDRSGRTTLITGAERFTTES